MKIPWETDHTRRIYVAAVASSKERAQLYCEVSGWVDSIVGVLGPLEDNPFWDQMGDLIKVVENYRDGLKRSNWPAQVANEIMRAVAVDSPNAEDAFRRMVKMVRFVAAYDRKVQKVIGVFGRMDRDFGLGNDGFGDMCDSYPLHGRLIFEASLKGDLPSKQSLGENYMRSNLQKYQRLWVMRVIHDLYRKEEDDTLYIE